MFLLTNQRADALQNSRQRPYSSMPMLVSEPHSQKPSAAGQCVFVLIAMPLCSQTGVTWDIETVRGRANRWGRFRPIQLHWPVASANALVRDLCPNEASGAFPQVSAYWRSL